MKKLQNKGAAMISVLVATVFIAIIATTLLYMAYLNYLTKAVRNASNDNFYTCEYALDDLATSLQQIAASTNSTADAIKNITLACTGVAGSSSGRYDDACVTSVVTLANQIADISISSNVPTGTNNYIVSGNSITLKGLVITATSKDDADPYKATITTDLTLSFNISSDNGMNVNDFSIINDEVISWVNGGVLVMTGNIFTRAPKWIEDNVTYSGDDGTLQNTYKNENDYTITGHNAITCGNIGGSDGCAVVSLTGERGIIVGNVCVGNGGVLTITGNVNVIGNVYVMDGGVLLVSDKFHCSGKVYTNVTGHSSGTVRGSSIGSIEKPSMNVEYLIDKDKAGNGLTTNLFSDFYLLYKSSAGVLKAEFSSEFDTFGYGGTPSALSYMIGTMCVGNTNDSQSVTSRSVTNPNTGLTYTVDCKLFRNNGGGNGLDNPTLYIYADTTNNLWMQYDMKATTVLSLKPFSEKGTFQGGVTISHMSDYDYQAALDTLVTLKDGGLNGYKAMKDHITYFGSTSKPSDENQLGRTSSFATGTIEDMIYVKDHGTTDTYVTEYTVGSEVRYAVYSNGKTYFPFGYFIRPDAGEYITMIFNSITSETSPTNTSITYDNWKKNEL